MRSATFTLARPSEECVYRTAALFVLAALILPVQVSARPKRNLPDNSPLLWTLTDEISPTELRRARNDPQAVRLRAKASRMAPEARSRLTDFVDGRATPALVTMAEALTGFAGYFDSDVAGEASIGKLVAWYQHFHISTDGADRLTEFMVRMDKTYKRHQSLVGTDHVDIAKSIARLEEQTKKSHPKLWIAFETNDLKTLSKGLDMPIRKLRKKLRYNYDPWDRYLSNNLPQLRSDLSPYDWKGLRTMLYEVVVPGFSSISQ